MSSGLKDKFGLTKVFNPNGKFIRNIIIGLVLLVSSAGGFFALSSTSFWAKKGNFQPGYTISYNTDGGNTIDNFTYDVETEVILASTPTKAGYTFSNWKVTSANGNWTENNTYEAGENLGIGWHGNITLTAQWQTKTTTLTTNNLILDANKNPVIEQVNHYGLDLSYDAITGIVTINGTATQGRPNWFFINKNTIQLSAGQYTLAYRYLSGNVVVPTVSGQPSEATLGVTAIGSTTYNLIMADTTTSVAEDIKTVKFQTKTTTVDDYINGFYIIMWSTVSDQTTLDGYWVFDNFKMQIALVEGAYDSDTMPFNQAKIGALTYDQTYTNAVVDTSNNYKKGYAFAGYYTQASGGVKVIGADGKLVADVAGYTVGQKWAYDGTALKLYAQWAVDAVTVTFDANGGEVDVTSKPVKYNETYGGINIYPELIESNYQSLNTTCITLNGAGDDWSTVTMDNVNSGQTFANIFTKSVENLIADGQTYTLVVEFRNVTGSGTLFLSQSNVPQQLSNGMNISKSVSNGTLFVELVGTDVDDAQMLIRAFFNCQSGNTFSADFRIGLYLGSINQDTYSYVAHGQSLTNNLPIPTRQGYTFTGWHTGSENGNLVTSNTQVTNLQDHTLYAHWQANTYTVSFDSNGGSGTMQDQTFTYDVAQNLNKNTFAKVGYSFNNWAHLLYSSDAEITNNAALRPEFVQYVDLAPYIDQYGLVKYRLELDIRSRDISKQNQILIYLQNGAGARYAGLNYTVQATTEWQHVVAEFTPRLENENEAQAMLSFFGTYDTGNIAHVKNVKLYRTFEDQQSVMNLATEGNITLSAQWKVDSYTITYNTDGGSAVAAQGYDIENSITLAAAPTKAGYVFNGWKVTTAAGNWTANETFTAGQNVGTGKYGNVTLTAQWIEAEARIGSVYYATLEEAFTVATAGSTIHIVKSAIAIDAISVAKQFTLSTDVSTVITRNGTSVMFNITANGDLKIIGNGESTITIRGNRTYANETWTDNAATQQAVLVYGKFEASENVIIENHYCNENGSGIFSFSNSIVTISGATLQNNKTAAHGGAMSISGKLEATGGLITNNSTSTESGHGGAMIIYGSSDTSTLSNITISNNTTLGVNGNITLWYNSKVIFNEGTVIIGNSSGRGAVYVYGDATYGYGTLTINGATFSNNSATSYGGSIYNLGTVTINNATITGNTATYGAGIYNNNSLTINNANISNNTASNNGGAIYNHTNATLNISGGTFTGNTASGYAGALYNLGTANISGTATFTNNTSTYHINTAIYTYRTASLNISGGSIISENVAIFAEHNALFAEMTEPSVTITGGEISGGKYAIYTWSINPLVYSISGNPTIVGNVLMKSENARILVSAAITSSNPIRIEITKTNDIDYFTNADNPMVTYADGVTPDVNDFTMYNANTYILQKGQSLYARSQYTLTYNTNGGTPANWTENYLYEQTVTVTTTVPTKAGYTFTGWSDGTTTYSAGETFTMPNSNVTLTAQWQEAVARIVETNVYYVTLQDAVDAAANNQTIELIVEELVLDKVVLIGRASINAETSVLEYDSSKQAKAITITTSVGTVIKRSSNYEVNYINNGSKDCGVLLFVSGNSSVLTLQGASADKKLVFDGENSTTLHTLIHATISSVLNINENVVVRNLQTTDRYTGAINTGNYATLNLNGAEFNNISGNVLRLGYDCHLVSNSAKIYDCEDSWIIHLNWHADAVINGMEVYDCTDCIYLYAANYYHPTTLQWESSTTTINGFNSHDNTNCYMDIVGTLILDGSDVTVDGRIVVRDANDYAVSSSITTPAILILRNNPIITEHIELKTNYSYTTAYPKVDVETSLTNSYTININKISDYLDKDVAVVTYAQGVTPNVSNFTLTDSNYALHANNQSLYVRSYRTLTYNINGGTPTIASETHYYGKTVTVTTTVPTKDGYTFAGWSDGTTTYSAGETFTMPNSNVTLTAQWQVVSYTITYNTDGGSAVEAQNYTIETDVTIAAAPTKAGYSFDYWLATTAEGSWGLNDRYEANEGVSTGNYGNVTLTAQWIAKDVTVTIHTYSNDEIAGYLANDCSANGTYKVGDILTLNAVVNDTFYIWQWYRNNNYDDIISGVASTTYTITPEDGENGTLNITVGFLTERTAIAVTDFVSEDMTGGGVKTYGDNYFVKHSNRKLYTNGIHGVTAQTANSGYVFAGWYEVLPTLNNYTELDPVSTDIQYTYSEALSGRTYYALYLSEHIVTFDNNDGSNLVNLAYDTSKELYNGVTTTYDPQTGIYVLDGESTVDNSWFELARVSADEFVEGDMYTLMFEVISGTKSSSNASYYPVINFEVLKPNGYSVSQRCNIDVHSNDITTHKLLLTINSAAAQEGEYIYIRIGWGQGQTFDNYTFRFSVYKGDVSERVITPMAKKVTYAEAYGDLPVPEREGYTFEGWYGKNIIPYPYHHGSTSTYQGLTYTLNNDGGVTANGTSLAWNWYVFADNNIILEKDHTYTLYAELDMGTVTICWYPSGSDQLSRKYVTANATNYVTFTMTETVTIHTLYWSPTSTETVENVKCKVALYDNEEITKYYAPTGYGVEQVTNIDQMIVPFNHTLVAKWSQSAFTITYVYDNGAANQTQGYSVTETITLQNAPVKENYRFNGWQVTTADGNWVLNEIYDAGEVIAAGKNGNITLTAIWVRLSTLTLNVNHSSNCTSGIMTIIRVFDITNKKLWTFTITEDTTITLKNLETSSYLISFSNASNHTGYVAVQGNANYKTSLITNLGEPSYNLSLNVLIQKTSTSGFGGFDTNLN